MVVFLFPNEKRCILVVQDDIKLRIRVIQNFNIYRL